MEKKATKWENGRKPADIDAVRLNDIGFRLILIPAFGIVIPLVTGMMEDARFSLWQQKLSFLYTIGISFVIWQGNRFLLFTLRSYFDWFNKPLRKIIALLLTIPFYTVPVSVLLLVVWYRIFRNGQTDWNTVGLTTLIILIAVLFIVHVYETVFLVKEAESEKVMLAQTEKARAEAELEALKNQIDPHFMFNSLNTLSHLIEEDPQKARRFNDLLADVYRYILQNKARDLVLVREEIGFLNDYFSLLKIRFEEAVQLRMDIPDEELDQYLVPPISLQVLAENAIKHNEFNDVQPLIIDIRLRGDELVVHNNLQRKILRRRSSGVGLQNLEERYQLTTRKSITIRQDTGDFTVCLPVLKIA
ncbi:MAG: histidine kinase [Chitinophagaceae bacterium]|nr:histidine kinase [Chitinophagaceae bacterium]